MPNKNFQKTFLITAAFFTLLAGYGCNQSSPPAPRTPTAPPPPPTTTTTTTTAPDPDPATLPYIQAAEPKYNGYDWVGSRNDPQALGGYSPCNNLPIPLTADLKLKSPSGVLSLVVTDETVAFFGRKGIRFYIINRTSEEAAFSAVDSRPGTLMQAQNAQGEWQDIERFHEPICGNSYHRVFLPEMHAWKTACPLYEGSFKTKLRLKLAHPGPPANPPAFIYSNEFDGSINPGQFATTPAKAKGI